MKMIGGALIVLLFMSGCAPQYVSPHDLIVQDCTKAGYQDKELDKCIKVATETYIKEFNRIEKENAKAQERARKELAKAQEQARQAQLKADKDKCRSFGFKTGTSQFASCMLQVEQQRISLIAQERQIQANRESAEMQLMGNYLLQQEAIKAINQPTTTNCTSRYNSLLNGYETNCNQW